MVTFGIKGGLEAGSKLTDALVLCSNLANVGDAKTLVIHPASTSHGQLTPEEQLETGVTPDLIRVRSGLNGKFWAALIDSSRCLLGSRMSMI